MGTASPAVAPHYPYAGLKQIKASTFSCWICTGCQRQTSPRKSREGVQYLDPLLRSWLPEPGCAIQEGALGPDRVEPVAPTGLRRAPWAPVLAEVAEKSWRLFSCTFRFCERRMGEGKERKGEMKSEHE